MEIKGTLVKKLQTESGTSKAGKPWEKQMCIIDTETDYKNQVAITFFGDKISLLDNVNEGENVIVSCNVYSREYNGRYYHNIDGYFFTNQTNASSGKITNGESEEDMPF